MTNSEKALKMHEEWHGKIETCAKIPRKLKEKIWQLLTLLVLRNLVR